MGKNSAISWTDSTYNPWWGCQRVSPGCEHCYAETFSHRLGFDVWGPSSTTGRRFFGDKHWNEPLRWDRDAAAAGVRPRVFCGSMCDWAEDHPELVEPRARLFDLVRRTPNLDWLMLTKRAENLARMVPWMEDPDRRPWPNVWLGTTAEDQEHYSKRWPLLRQIPAVVRFVSYEPALGALHTLDFPDIKVLDSREVREGDVVVDLDLRPLPVPHWLIIGGESGHGARRFDVAWARAAIRECRRLGIVPFMKQLGANVVESFGDFRAWPAGTEWEREDEGGCAHIFRVRVPDGKGDVPAEWPVALRVQEFPEVRA